MADEQIRDLERQSALGDSEAQQRLIAIRNRSGLSNLHVDYFKDYLDLTDELLKRCSEADKRDSGEPDANEEYEDSEQSGYFYDNNLSSARWAFRGIVKKFEPRLQELNAKYLALGIEKELVRSTFPGQPAITMEDAWYNSSCY